MGRNRHRNETGKAQKAGFRKRASRLHLQQLVSEYEGFQGDYYNFGSTVPIRYRSEFVPSTVTRVEAVQPRRATKEVPSRVRLSSSSRRREEGTTEAWQRDQAVLFVSPPAAHATNRDRITFKQSVTTDQLEKTSKILRDNREAAGRRRGRVSTYSKPPGSTQGVSQKEFTLRGFFYGCVLGSAAAAMFLLLLQVALGG